PEWLEEVEGGITAVEGIKAAGIACGIKGGHKKDLALIFSDAPAYAAAVFTSNIVKAAHIEVCKETIKKGKVQAVIINSGNANACTGEEGKEAVKRVINSTAQTLGIDSTYVFMASTGKIGVPLPEQLILSSLERLRDGLREDGGREAAEAILTTDTKVKEAACKFKLEGKEVCIGACAKGAGMICPDMATMLCFVATSVSASPQMLKRVLKEAVGRSFNCISVDGDQSTNDTVLLLANGKVEVELDEKNYSRFSEALLYIFQKLAIEIVKDGEGATKVIEINVKGTREDREAHKIASAIARSALFRAAMHGSDLNWGRIFAAAGTSGVPFNYEDVTLAVNGIKFFARGKIIASAMSKAQESLKEKEIIIWFHLPYGEGEGRFWCCDLSEEYVRVNSVYST
ncbi:MAG: bifunctional glutamate N-acetyltransferase/amino-acid acetyltransferase ArgJ, partial [Candidatus Freyarchaeota archaeon]